MRILQVILKNKWAFVFVGLPILVSALYYGLVASDQYVSESRFVVKSQSRQTPQLPSLTSILQSGGMTSGQEKTNEVVSFIKSRGALSFLEEKYKLRERYSSGNVDRFSRFPDIFRDSNFENLYRYYNGMVDAHVDTDSGLAVLTVKAFDANDAFRINALLLEASEGLVNRLNQSARSNAISEASKRLAVAEERLIAARLTLANYRNREGLLDPTRQATGVLEITNRLIAERTAIQTQLRLTQSAAPRNPAIPSMIKRIEALSVAIDAQTGRAVGTKDALSSKMAGYDKLTVEEQFATQMFATAEASLEQARAESQRQQFYIERVVEPNKPDVAQLPNALRRVIVVAAAAACLYLIGWMLLVGIIEHSPED